MAITWADGECFEDAHLEDPRERWDDDATELLLETYDGPRVPAWRC